MAKLTLKYKKYVKRLTHITELFCAAGALSLSADFLWLLHDIVINGLSIVYCFVGFGLIFGIVLTLIIWAKHFFYFGKYKIVRRRKRKSSAKAK